MVGRLDRVMMRRPGAILDADPERWHYAHPIDADALARQFDGLVATLHAHQVEIDWLDGTDAAPDDGLADSVFTFDPSFMIPAGALLLRPGKDLRRHEVGLHRAFYERTGTPIVGAIEAPGTVEGGDCCWIDRSTRAVGRGARTNQSGSEQLSALLRPHGIEVVAVDLPYLHGPEACLHLLSILNPLDVDLALVHLPLVPYVLVERLHEAGIELIDVPHDEFTSSNGLNVNVLALAPRRVLAIDGFPTTRKLMEHAGCEVDTFAADELCLPCEGGPTCLTRPLTRQSTTAT